MPEDCLTKFKKLFPEVARHIRDKSGIEYNEETKEGRDKFIEAIREVQKQNEDNLKNIYGQLGIEGYGKKTNIQPDTENKQSKQQPEEEIKPIEPSTESGEGAKEPPTGEKETVKIFSERPGTELSFRGLQVVANEFGLDDVKSRTTKTDLEAVGNARKTVSDWAEKGQYKKNIEALLKGVENSEFNLLDEQRIILQQHLANEVGKLRELKNAPKEEFDKQFNYVKRLKEVGQIARQEAGAALRIPIGGSVHPVADYGDAMVAMAEANNVDELTEEQKKQVNQLVSDYEKKAQIAEEKMADMAAKFSELKAKKEVETTVRVRKSVNRKTAEEYKKERQSFKDELKAAKEEHLKWLKDNGIQQSGLGGVVLTNKMVKAIKKIIASHVDEIGGNLAEVTASVFNDVKDFIEGVTEKDIHNIIAGEYAEKRPTKNQLQIDLRDLQDEAALINKLADLMEGKEPTSENKKVERNRKIKDLREKIKELKNRRDDANTFFTETDISDDAKKLKAVIQRNNKKADAIKKDISEGNFDKEEKEASWINNAEIKKAYPKLYNEAIDAISNKEQAMLDFDIAVFKAQQEKRTLGKKAIDWAAALIATSKAVKSGIDDSAIMMQNIVAMVSHPRSAVKALKEHALDAVSEKRFQRYLTELHNSPMWDLIEKSGLDITNPKSLKNQNKEEIFDNNLLNKDFKIKGKKYNIGKYVTRPFERAFTSLGNAMRVNMFTKIAEREYNKPNPRTFESDPDFYKSLATMLNTQTGRGKLHTQVQRASKLITAGIWSPRLMASRLNMLGLSELAPLYGGKGYYAGLTPEIRKMALKDMAKFIGAGVSLMLFAGANGAEVDDDPESPTFGTIKIGDKKYNTWGGFTPYVKTIVSGFTGKRNIDGERKPVTRAKLIGSFFRSRLTPAAGTVTNLLVGKDFSGKPTTPENELKQMVTPMSISGVYDGLQKDGIIGILTQGIPSFIGVGVSDERDFESSSGKIELKYRDINGNYIKRESSEEESKKYKEYKEKETEEVLNEYKQGKMVKVNGYGDVTLGSGSGTSTIPYDKLTDDQKKDLLSKIKQKAGEEAKEKLIKEIKNN